MFDQYPQIFFFRKLPAYKAWKMYFAETVALVSAFSRCTLHCTLHLNTMLCSGRLNCTALILHSLLETYLCLLCLVFSENVAGLSWFAVCGCGQNCSSRVSQHSLSVHSALGLSS